MPTRDQAVQIKGLARRVRRICEIAQQRGRLPKAFRRPLREAQATQHAVRSTIHRTPSQPRRTPYGVYLRGRIDTAWPYRTLAAVLRRQSQERGYPGGIIQLKAFTKGSSRGVADEPVMRPETAPDMQMRPDFTCIRHVFIPYWTVGVTCGHVTTRMNHRSGIRV